MQSDKVLDSKVFDNYKIIVDEINRALWKKNMYDGETINNFSLWSRHLIGAGARQSQRLTELPNNVPASTTSMELTPETKTFECLST